MHATTLSLLATLLVIILVSFPSATAEGMTSHPWLTYLAYTYTSSICSTNPNLGVKIKKALDENQNTLSMASSFPDYFYLPSWATGVSEDLMQPYRDSSEDSHWPPFQSTLAEYIRKLPDFNDTEWSKNTSQAVAQLFGMGSHFMVDMTWEGLQNPGVAKNVTYWTALARGRGFSSFMSAQNWGDGGYGNHNEMPTNLASDSGLPFLGLANPVAVGFDNSDRNLAAYPNALMGQLLRNAGHDVDDAVINRVSIIYDLLFTLINVLGPYLNGAIDELMYEQPKAAEDLFEYPVGGLIDMGWWVAQVWQRYASWLESGTPFGGDAAFLERISTLKRAQQRQHLRGRGDSTPPPNPFINDGGACSYCDDYAGWSKQCFDKLQPVVASLKDFGSYAQKFKQLWEKEDFQHPVTSLVSIVSELGDGAVDFFPNSIDFIRVCPAAGCDQQCENVQQRAKAECPCHPVCWKPRHR